MRVFRWLLLIANVIFLMIYASSLVIYVVATNANVPSRSVVGWVVAPLLVVIIFNLANIVFILITWRWRHEGKAARRIAGAFD